MKYKNILLLICTFYTAYVITKESSPHTITLFFEQYPELAADLKPLPSKHKHAINGIPVSYFGYQSSSNDNGQVTLPRKHQKDSFVLAITQNITPVVMTENTLYGWRLDTRFPFSLYTITRLQDPQTKLWYWHTKKSTHKAHDLLPPEALIITAKPQDIVIFEGATITTNSPQLLLPTMYVRPTIDNAKNALCALTHRLFFKPLLPTYKVNNKLPEIERK